MTTSRTQEHAALAAIRDYLNDADINSEDLPRRAAWLSGALDTADLAWLAERLPRMLARDAARRARQKARAS